MSIIASDMYIERGQEVVFTMIYTPSELKPGTTIPYILKISLSIDMETDHVHTIEFPVEAGKTIKHEYAFTFDTPGYHDADATFNWTAIDENGKITSDKKILDTITIGVTNWVFNAGGNLGCIKSSPLVNYDASLEKTTVYLGSEDSNLYALDTLDGREKWRFTARGAISSTPAMDSEGRLYFGCEGGFVYCIRDIGESYEELWIQPVNGPVFSSPALDEKLQLLYIGSTDSHLYALKMDDNGTRAWPPFQTGGKITSSPVIGFDNTIYIGSLDNYLYALEPDGTEKWRFNAKSDIVGSPALDKDGTIFFGTAAFGGGIDDDNGLFALSRTGNEKWFVRHGSSFFSTPVIGANGTICIGSFTNTMFGIDRRGGSLAKFKVFSDDHVASVAVGSRDYIFSGSKDGMIYGLDLKNGNSYKGRDEFWRYDVGDPITSSSPTIHGGAVYFGTCGYDRGSIYSLPAVKTGSGQSGIDMEINDSSPWPIFRGNSRNTGKTKYTGDTVHPEILLVEPASGENDLDLSKRSITVTFSLPMDPESVYRPETDTREAYYGLTLEPFDSSPDKFQYIWNATHTQCELKLPDNEFFKPYVTYTAILLSKAKAAEISDDATSRALLYNYSWSFSAMDEEEVSYEHDAVSSCFISHLLEKAK
ncbi:MAG: PQQ-binding-like beta-propeller repeat protein [Desulfobacterium sp.]|nr:PQQ-binding-like beta-propeller repeat protein [Desulfobacterium sp.]